MRVLSVGTVLNRKLASSTSFGSSVSFLDYDLVICDFSNSLSGYHFQYGHDTYMGYPCLDDDSSVKISNDIARRKAEIRELLKLGRMVVIFTSTPVKCYIGTGETLSSGTGRNARITRMVNQIDVTACLPIPVSTVVASGESIEFHGNEPFKSFWNANKDNFVYEAYLEKQIGHPLFVIEGTNQTIGFYHQIDNGHLLFVPSLRTKKPTSLFVESLITLFDNLKQDTGDFELPEWTREYLLPNEQRETDNLRILENELSQLLALITKQKEKIAIIEQYKISLCGSGRALEVVVQKILSEIGFEVREGAPGRDDMILNYNEQVVVAEIKGVGKSAAEKHAAQLEKWVSEYFSTHGMQPKGILIVNAFKDIPIKDRTESPFPDQMIGYSQHREHCLITTFQLLGIYFDVLQNPEKKDELIKNMLATQGVYTEYQNWSEFIVQREISTSENIV
jgi:hypothetical protein